LHYNKEVLFVNFVNRKAALQAYNWQTDSTEYGRGVARLFYYERKMYLPNLVRRFVNKVRTIGIRLKYCILALQMSLPPKGRREEILPR
jgi:hypothetical protein